MKKALAVLTVGVLVLGVAGSALAEGRGRYRQDDCRYYRDGGCHYECRRDDDRGPRNEGRGLRDGSRSRQYDGRGANRR